VLSFKAVRAVLASVTLGLLLLVCVQSSYKPLKDLLYTSSRPEANDVSFSEKRFDQIKPLLPAHGRVCYVDHNTASVEETARYYQAQYTLSPRLIVRGTDCPFLIVNFDGQISDRVSSASPGFTLLRNYGGGLALWQRRMEPTK